MGRVIEEPVRELIEHGHAAVSQHIREKGGKLLYIWMALLFLKTHLRDRTFRENRDLRVESDQISDRYEWEMLHHLHTIARSFYTGAHIDSRVFGTMFVLPARAEANTEAFDFCDLYTAQTVMIRLDDVAMVAVFTDCTAASPQLFRRLENANGAFSTLQLREIMVEAACANMHIAERPQFHSLLDLERHTNDIVASAPDPIRFQSADLTLRGALMEYAFRPLFAEEMTFAGFSHASEFWGKIREGTATFLYRDDGTFITEQMLPKLQT